jgi:predicted ester cyclase
MDDIERVWYQYIEKLFNERNVALVEVLFSPDYVLNGETYSYAQIHDYLQSFFTGFPDCYITITEQFTSGICIICKWTLHGTHLGEFRGRKATGKKVRLRGKSEVFIYRGKIVKQWREMDEGSLDEQLEGPGTE